jgi:hypothetical protein
MNKAGQELFVLISNLENKYLFFFALLLKFQIGIDESEAHVSFSEHVFLDAFLEEFPDIAPVQEFMVLALNGLSKNSFLSVGEKRAVVEWYKTYFKEKEELIVEALQAERLENEYRENLELEKEKQNKNM